MIRRSKDFTMVETIYEADEEEEEEEEEKEDNFYNSVSSLTLSPSTLSSPHLSSPTSTPTPLSPLEAIVDYWTRFTGKKSDIIIRVRGRSFHLHGEPVSSRSRYLKRRLRESADVTISPPLNLTLESFASVARFCYGWAPPLTSSNVAAIRIAAELLEMNGDGGGLVWLTEMFFRREVAGNEEAAAAILRECVGMLPAAGEAAASMAARCAAVLAEAEEDVSGAAAALTGIPAVVFRMIAECWAEWSRHDHDSLYRIVDQYIVMNKEMLSEEEKQEICSTIKCSALSNKILIKLIKNPVLPLRFVLQASLLGRFEPHRRSLSFIHDATTALRIESLERDVAGLRRRLRWSEEKRAEMGTVRSGSFRGLSDAPPAPAPPPPSLPLRDKRRSFRRKLVDKLRSFFRF